MARRTPWESAFSAEAQREINDIDVRFFKNQKRPQVDLFGTYGLTGLAGTQTTGANPFAAERCLKPSAGRATLTNVCSPKRSFAAPAAD